MLRGYDVSHHQDPDTFEWGDPKKWDWVGLEADPDIKFMIARASYGKSTADKDFVEFAKLIRDNGLVFGTYHFYRQIHSVEDQMALFDRQLEAVGGLVAGDLFPVLDMEHNGAHGDGKPKPSLFSESCRRIAEAWREEYGGCILYYSSYFPEWLAVKKQPELTSWMKAPGYHHWLADYDRDPGNPRTPYTDLWALHQYRPQPTKWYKSGAVVDQNVVNPAVDFESLLIGDLDDDVSDDAVDGETGTDDRPGGAFPEDFHAGVDLMYQGAELTKQGLELLRRRK